MTVNKLLDTLYDNQQIRITFYKFGKVAYMSKNAGETKREVLDNMSRVWLGFEVQSIEARDGVLLVAAENIF